jgi:hypothetical protein
MMDKYNHKDEGTEGPGIHWDPNSVGDYKRGLEKVVESEVETEDRKGGGQKA